MYSKELFTAVEQKPDESHGSASGAVCYKNIESKKGTEDRVVEVRKHSMKMKPYHNGGNVYVWILVEQQL